MLAMLRPSRSEMSASATLTSGVNLNVEGADLGTAMVGPAYCVVKYIRIMRRAYVVFRPEQARTGVRSQRLGRSDKRALERRFIAVNRSAEGENHRVLLRAHALRH